MTIPSSEIPEHLSLNSEAKIQVVFASGKAAFVADPYGIRTMCRHHMLSGEVNKHGYLKYVRLLVSSKAARRVQDACRLPSFGSKITTNKQNPGATRWVEHLERSKCGVSGGCAELHPLAALRVPEAPKTNPIAIMSLAERQSARSERLRLVLN